MPYWAGRLGLTQHAARTQQASEAQRQQSFLSFFHVKIGVIDPFLFHLALTQRFLAAAEASIVRDCVLDASFSFSPNPNLDHQSLAADINSPGPRRNPALVSIHR